MSGARKQPWDYPQSAVIGFGMPTNPEDWRLGKNTLGNTISHEIFTAREAKMVAILPKINKVLEDGGIDLRFTVRAPFNPDAVADDSDYS
jgi:hypothetical protein